MDQLPARAVVEELSLRQTDGSLLSSGAAKSYEREKAFGLRTAVCVQGGTVEVSGQRAPGYKQGWHDYSDPGTLLAPGTLRCKKVSECV